MIYIVTEEYGDYYDIQQYVLGYTYSKDEAEALVSSLKFNYIKFLEVEEAYRDAIELLDIEFENSIDYTLHDKLKSELDIKYGYNIVYDYVYYEVVVGTLGHINGA